MKLAVVSDIHGNLEAFEAVLADMEKTRPDQIHSLGDNIGYGPDSAAVMDILMERQIPSVMGNYEMAVAHPRFMNWFNPLSRRAVAQAASVLPDRALAWIKEFPTSRILPLEPGPHGFQALRLVHGLPPDSPFLYLFQMSDPALARRIRTMDEPLCFAGHTHDLEWFACRRGKLVHRKLKEKTLCLNPGEPCIINAGAVGQPRDGEPSAKYMILDTRTLALEIRYCTYDFAKTQAKIRAAGIPETFAEKLGISFRNEA